MLPKNLLSLFSAVTVLYGTACQAQQVGKFTINPYLNGNFSISDKYLEVGPSIDKKVLTYKYFDTQGREIKSQRGEWDGNRFSANTLTISHRIFARIPLSQDGGNVGIIDRQLNDVRLSYTYAKSGHSVNIYPTERIYVYRSSGIKFEGGYKKFDYYPTGKSDEERSFNAISYAFEIMRGIYTSRSSRAVTSMSQESVVGDSAVTIKQEKKESGDHGSSPTGFQLRFRIDHQFKAADERGVAGPTTNGLPTTQMLVLEKPSNKTIISPAGAWILTSNKDNTQQVIAAYAEIVFNDGFSTYAATRTRLEYWILLLPDIKGLPNTKIGVGPLLNIRVDGSDALRKVEAGVQATVRLSSLPARFFE